MDGEAELLQWFDEFHGWATFGLDCHLPHAGFLGQMLHVFGHPHQAFASFAQADHRVAVGVEHRCGDPAVRAVHAHVDSPHGACTGGDSDVEWFGQGVRPIVDVDVAFDLRGDPLAEVFGPVSGVGHAGDVGEHAFHCLGSVADGRVGLEYRLHVVLWTVGLGAPFEQGEGAVVAACVFGGVHES